MNQGDANSPAEADVEVSPPTDIQLFLCIVDEVARELHPHQSAMPAATLDSRLDRELGFDSLGRMELASRIERRFKVSFPEALLADAETPRDLLQALQSSPHPILSARRERIPGPQESVAARPRTARTLVEVLDWHCDVHPERRHVVFYQEQGQGDILSYGELREQALEVACGLQARGLRAKETVVLMLPTGSQYLSAFYGVLMAGGIPVPIYPPFRKSQIEDHLRRQATVLRNCRARILLTVPEAKNVGRLLRSGVETLDGLYTVDELKDSGVQIERTRSRSEDIAFVQYTSGSTGTPKGVVLSHDNLLANIRAIGEAMRAVPEDVCVSWLPLYHDMGLIGAWLGSLYHAVPLVLMSPLEFLRRPERWLWAIHQYQGTISAAPNFAFELCLRKIERSDIEGLALNSWRLALNGAESISPTTLEGFMQRFASYGFRRQSMFPVYGLAECSVGLTFPPLDRPPLIDCIERDALMGQGRAVPVTTDNSGTLRIVACGQPLPGHQARVVDRFGRELPEREEGRLQFRGPSATSGYFHNPDETKRLFDGEWLESGDRAYFAGGDLHITGRFKDIIIRAGRNIYPQEIEARVGEIAGIRNGRVAVFGSQDAGSGTERLVIVAETREQDATARTSLNKRITEITTDLIGVPPDDLILAPPDSVRKTSSGKVRRSAMRQLYEQGSIDERERPPWLQVGRLALSSIIPQLLRVRRSLAATAWATYFWIVIVLSTLPVCVLVMAVPDHKRHWSILRNGARWIAWATGTKFRVEGAEQLAIEREPCIVIANHASYLDVLVLVAGLPRPVSFLAKNELRKQPLLHWFLRRIDVQFVDRDDLRRGMEDTRSALRGAGALPLVVFPEGTFKRMPGLLPFHMGGFLVAAESGIPVVPVAISGTRSMLRADSWFPRPGAVSLSFGTSIIPTTKGKDTWRAALELRDAARAHLLRHIGEPDLGTETDTRPN